MDLIRTSCSLVREWDFCRALFSAMSLLFRSLSFLEKDWTRFSSSFKWRFRRSRNCRCDTRLRFRLRTLISEIGQKYLWRVVVTHLDTHLWNGKMSSWNSVEDFETHTFAPILALMQEGHQTSPSSYEHNVGWGR